MKTLYEMTMEVIKAQQTGDTQWLKRWVWGEEWAQELDNVISSFTYPEFHRALGTNDKIVLGVLGDVLFIAHTPKGCENDDPLSYAIPLRIIKANDPATEAFRDCLQRTIKTTTSIIEQYEVEIQSLRTQADDARKMLERLGGIIHEQFTQSHHGND